MNGRMHGAAMLLVVMACLNSVAPSAGQPLQATAVEDTVVVTDAHYRIFDRDGTPVTWDQMAAALGRVDVVLVGETHDDPVAHYLEARILEAAIADQTRPTAASMEMFTRDVQLILNEYLAGLISEQQFRAASEPWGNYQTDYRPFVEIAREAGRPVIAANAPRRYVNRVSRNGAESLSELSDAAKAWLAPLPYALASEAYAAEWNALMMEAMGGMPTDTTGGGGGGMHGMMGSALQAQALWDATMAWSIVEHLTRNPGDQVVHIVGSFHVKNGTGTPEQIQRYRPGTSSLIVVVEPAEDVTAFDADEHAGLGDFVILADQSLPRTKR